MQRFSRLVALGIGIVSAVGMGAQAALEPQPLTPAFASTDRILMANRLRNRGFSFQVSSSRYRRGGFSRGSCPEGAVPIVPASEDETAAPSYLTASAHPTFLIYVPELPNADGIIYVEDLASSDRNPQLYKADFTLTGEAGLVGISMPETAPALEEGNRYRWRVVINCAPEEGGSNTIVFSGGEVQRVANIEGTAEERLGYYLEAGIWQETAAILASDRHNEANPDVDEEWAILMEESGIPQFSATPIVEMLDGQLVAD